MFTAFCHMRGASYTKIHIDVSPLIEPREQLRKQKEEMSKPFFYISYDKAKTSISYLFTGEYLDPSLIIPAKDSFLQFLSYILNI